MYRVYGVGSTLCRELMMSVVEETGYIMYRAHDIEANNVSSI